MTCQIQWVYNDDEKWTHFAKKEFWNSLKTSFEMGIEKHDYFQLFWYSPVASW